MRNLLFVLIGLFVFIGCSSDNNEEDPISPEEKYDVIVNVNMPGLLSSNIPNQKFSSIKINGDLNGTDIKFLRGIMHSLSSISLENANIVEGGDSYYNITHKTQNNTIGRFMFSKISGNFKIKLPNTITKIEQEAFIDCDGLKEIIIFNNVKNIGQSAFSGCKNLSKIQLSTQITTIEFETFKDCESLEEIEYPTNLKIIKSQAFYNCKKLKSITTPASLTTIESSVFSGCESLSSVVLSSNIIKLGAQAFDQCINIKEIKLPEKITKLEQSVLRGTSITSIIIPDNVTSIKDYAFQDCKNLTSIKIPQNVSELGYIPFAGCENLIKFEVNTNNENFKEVDGCIYSKNGKIIIYYPIGSKNSSITIPNGVEDIGDASFMDSKNLISVYLPSSVKNIRERAFSWCANLSEVHCSATTPPILGTNLNYSPFPDQKIDKLVVPQGFADVYKNCQWSKYFNLITEQ